MEAYKKQPPILTLPSLMQIPSLRGMKVRQLSSPSQDSLYSTIISIIEEETPLDPFYIMDLGMLVTLYHSWLQNLPSIKPFFPVRCNPDQALLATLLNLGASFDCASRAEIARVIALGVSSDRILFSNPCKSEENIRYAAGVGIKMLVFHSVEELEKIRMCHPRCSLLLHVDSPPGDGEGSSQSARGANKSGALPQEVIPLLKHAQQLSLNVIGISFEPEGCRSRPKASRAAIEVMQNAIRAFSLQGLPSPIVVNVGGGFNFGSSFAQETATIRQTFETKFSDMVSLLVIASPGRFLAETACVLVTNVIGKRVRGELREYWINDGVYGSMNSVIYHQKCMNAVPFACTSNSINPLCRGLKTFRSTVFGPTCDALDTVFTDQQLPELYTGDWLMFPNMGAYAHASATNFNGFFATSINTKYVYSTPALPTKR